MSSHKKAFKKLFFITTSTVALTDVIALSIGSFATGGELVRHEMYYKPFLNWCTMIGLILVVFRITKAVLHGYIVSEVRKQVNNG